MAADSYRSQAADVALLTAERIASCPAVVEVIEACGASVGALLAAAETAVGAALRESTHRTARLDSTRRSIPGSLPVARTFGRGTDADAYEVLRGAPVGCPESLRSQQREQAAAIDAARWERQNARAEAGIAVSRKSLRNAKRAAARARK